MIRTHVTTAKNIKRTWHLVDAKDKVLGRAASDIAQKLMGKSKPYYTPQLDCGDYVVVINANKIKLTGKKIIKKIYRHHTGFPGGFREKTASQVFSQSPMKIIEQAVSGMLPKNKLRQPRLRRLKVFSQETHPYTDKLKE